MEKGLHDNTGVGNAVGRDVHVRGVGDPIIMDVHGIQPCPFVYADI